MNADDEAPIPPEDEAHGSAGDAGEHVPPSTWAGRKRAEEAEAQEPEESDEEIERPDQLEEAEAHAEEPDEGSDDAPSGITEESDEIDAELAGQSEPAEVEHQPVAAAGEADGETDGVEADAETDGVEADAETDGVEADGAADPDVDDDAVEGGEHVEQAPSGEQAEDAALAGLRARTAQHEKKAGATSTPVEAARAAAVAVAGVDEESDESGKPPRARRLWARFLAASLVIVISMAAATSISLLLYLTDIAKGLNDNDALAGLREQLAEADGGDPQNILIIGSDKRLGPEGAGDPGRSDTTILLRVDPDKDLIALLSIPRDLKVNIPGYGVAKFNEAYSVGQEDKTLKTVKQLTGLDINHVVNINFTGFADAVDAIGCVYIDVDRRYFIPPEQGTAEIDIEAGYQRLCGLKALQYVRFRHEDNDLVRSARQQDFLREARQKLPPEVLIRDRNELLDIFTEYTTSDIGDAVPLLELLKTFAAVQDAPVSEVHFPAELGASYVTAGEGAIQEAVDQFQNGTGTPGARPGGESQDRNEADKPRADKPEDGGDKPEQDFVGPPMDDSSALGEQYADKVANERRKDGDTYVKFPVFYPTRLAPGSTINDASRAFNIDGPSDEVYYGYKLSVDVPGEAFGNGLLSEYYGVSGTDWVDAPILDNPSETRTIDGRAYQLFYDGDRLRLVGFKTTNAAYWVNNSLSQSLDEGQMLSIATSMRELGK